MLIRVLTMAGVWTKESVEYASEAEKLDDKMFNLMINRKGCRWFKSTEKQISCSVIDWYATSNKGKTLAIELKNRYLKPRYPDVMIEVDKYNAMIGSDKDKAYYINFLFNSADHVLVCNLRNIMVSDMRLEKNVLITPKQGKPYYGDRYYIPLNMFYYYVYVNDEIGYIKGTDNELVDYIRSNGYEKM